MLRDGPRAVAVGGDARLLVLGVLGAWRERPRPAHPEDDETAPPLLGSFTAARQAQPAVAAPAQPPSPGIGANDPGEDYRTMPLTNYRLWALAEDTSALEGRRIRMIGFVTPRSDGQWYLTRIQISCCAADAVAYTVLATPIGASSPPTSGSRSSAPTHRRSRIPTAATRRRSSGPTR